MTELEIKFLNALKSDEQFTKYGESSVDFYWFTNIIPVKQLRGVVANLMKKGIIDYSGNLPGNEHCWNPIYKGVNWRD